MIGRGNRRAPAPGADERRREEFDAVMRAADALDLEEFDFFRLAYRRWFGAQPLPQELEDAFAAYMLGRSVPVWVRQLARDVLAAGAAGARPSGSRCGPPGGPFGNCRGNPRIEPLGRPLGRHDGEPRGGNGGGEAPARRSVKALPADAFGAAAYRDRPRRHPHGRLYVGAVFVLWLALLTALLEGHRQPPSRLQGCGGAAGLPAVAAVAHALNGEAPPCTQLAEGGERRP